MYAYAPGPGHTVGAQKLLLGRSIHTVTFIFSSFDIIPGWAYFFWFTQAIDHILFSKVLRSGPKATYSVENQCEGQCGGRD